MSPIPPITFSSLLLSSKLRSKSYKAFFSEARSSDKSYKRDLVDSHYLIKVGKDARHLGIWSGFLLRQWRNKDLFVALSIIDHIHMKTINLQHG